MLKQILISLVITTLISLTLSAGAFFFNISFWGTFIITFIFQLIFFYVYNGYVQTKNSLKVEQIENERIAELSKQGTTVTCASCHQPSFVFLRFGQQNEYKCDSCNKNNSVYISVETAQVTVPVSNIKPAELPKAVIDDLAHIALDN